VRDIDTAVVDSLKVLDPNRPIREADIVRLLRHVRFVPRAEVVSVAGHANLQRAAAQHPHAAHSLIGEATASSYLAN
jgi:hypothetical protein